MVRVRRAASAALVLFVLLGAVAFGAPPQRPIAAVAAPPIMLAAVALFGAFTIVFGVSTLTWLSIFALAMLGATDMVSVYVRETLIQLWTPDQLRGRVNAMKVPMDRATFRDPTTGAEIKTRIESMLKIDRALPVRK